MPELPADIITRYLEDAIAAEKSFETQLRTFAKEGRNTEVQAAFSQHADETRTQYERLTARLEQLGGSPSVTKSFLAHMFNMAPALAKIGYEADERTTQNLMMAYAVENSEVAMYESLITAAEAAGDTQTASLARSIQDQERETAAKVWRFIAPAAREAVRSVAEETVSSR
jgi:ferritin-like metal-binding protein YciE